MIRITEQERKDIRQLYLTEQNNKPVFLDFQKGTGNVAGQYIFDYIRKHEGFVPHTYDDGYFPPRKYTGGKVKGKLTIGYGTTDPQYAKANNQIDKETAKQLSAKDINAAADCIKRWQSRNKNDFNNRKLTLGMYRALIDMAYNVGCNKLVNGQTIRLIEQGKYKSAYNRILNGNWGHDKRRQETAKLFCSSGGCIDAIKEQESVKKKDNVIYTAIFFDKDTITSKYPQEHVNLYSHHSTIEFKPESIDNLPIGETVKVDIIGRLTTDKVDVLIVDNPFSTNKFPHVTLSTADGVRPFESNKEIAENIDSIQPISDTLIGVVGYFDGKGDITENVNWNRFVKKTHWSAAFISYVMDAAGVRFPASGAHANYAQKIRNGFNGWKALNPKTTIPRKGDVIVKNRGTNRLKYNTRLWQGETHGDIVVGGDNNRLVVVGGNLSNTIKKLGVNLINGKLPSNYFVILRPNTGSEAIVKNALSEYKSFGGKKETDSAVIDTLKQYYKSAKLIGGTDVKYEAPTINDIIKNNSNSEVIKVNAFGRGVSEVKNILKALNYEVDVNDNNYTITTKEAVSKYQKDKNLESVDGIVGVETAKQLDKDRFDIINRD